MKKKNGESSSVCSNVLLGKKNSQPLISARTEMVAVAQKLAEIQVELHILQMWGQQEWKKLNTSEDQTVNMACWQNLLPSHHVSVFNIRTCFLSDSYFMYSKEASGWMSACKSLSFWKSLPFSNKETRNIKLPSIHFEDGNWIIWNSPWRHFLEANTQINGSLKNYPSNLQVTANY